MFEISLGIIAYNEEANISQLLQAVIRQRLTNSFLKEIIVVISGCTDKTEEIIRLFMQKDDRIKIFTQAKREGKASAINIFLSKATADILILESADTIPAEGAFDKLMAPFSDQGIGMTGARPVPVNSDKTFIGFASHLLWYKHHQVSLVSPKMGELVAFRNCIKNIPNDTAVDEASIETIITKKGYKLTYVEDAIVYNKGPETIRDFITQRRRIFAGHKQLLNTQSYKVGTYSPVLFMIKLMIRKKYWWNFKKNIWTIGVILLEIIGRMLGYYDFYIRKNNHAIWNIAVTTKKLN